MRCPDRQWMWWTGQGFIKSKEEGQGIEGASLIQFFQKDIPSCFKYLLVPAGKDK
jgi:hypothetical protein